MNLYIYIYPYPIYVMLDRFSYQNQIWIFICRLLLRKSYIDDTPNVVFLFYIEIFLTNRKLKKLSTLNNLHGIRYFFVAYRIFLFCFLQIFSHEIASLVLRLQKFKRSNSLAIISLNFTTGIASLSVRSMVIVSSREVHAFGFLLSFQTRSSKI